MNLVLLRRLAPITLVALSAVAVGCGNTVETGDGEGTGGDASGSGAETGTGGDTATSTSSGQTCEDPVIECPPGIGHACVDGEWECTYGTTIGSSSSGETETCPEYAPPPDTACSVEGMTCEVLSDFDCGPPTVDIICRDGVWIQITARCSPPLCRDLADADSCESFGCRWEEPGCGDSPLLVAGCFETTDCTVNGCIMSDEICTNVSVLPACATEEPGCDSCGEQVDLCVPQVVGEDDDGDDDDGDDDDGSPGDG